MTVEKRIEKKGKRGQSLVDSPEVSINFGFRVHSIRRALGLTQLEFCEKIGLASNSNLSEIENGKTRPGFDFFYKFGMHYNVNPFFLLFGEEPKFVGDKPERDMELQQFDFGLLKEPVYEMLYNMVHCEPFKYGALAFFSSFKHDNVEMLASHLKDAPPFKKPSD